MARISLGLPIYNHVEMRDGSTKCASCPFFSTQGRRFLSTDRHISPRFRSHRGLRNYSVKRSSRARVFVLLYKIVSVPRNGQTLELWLSTERLGARARIRARAR